jgi:hypothetical protein
MQHILGCNNKYGNRQKRKCNQYLVARVNIVANLLVASGYIATKHYDAIFHDCHDQMCCNRRVLPLQNYVGIWFYYHEL